MARKKKAAARHQRPEVERLEGRLVPALLASDFTLNPPVVTQEIGGPVAALTQDNISQHEVQALLTRASVATASNDGIMAVVDRGGHILGVLVEPGVAPEITQDPAKLAFAIDGAVAEARTAAFFANDTVPLTSRTIQYISQSTVTEREVNSDPSITDPNSTQRGPGFVAPVGLGGHFPPGVAFTPQVDLFGIENTNRDSFLNPGPDTIQGTPDDIALQGRFNIDPAFVPAGQQIDPPLSYGDTILSAADQKNAAIPHDQSRGIGTLPGGIPLFKYGTLVGGIGVFYPGKTGYATEENSSLSSTFDPTKPDRSLEAEFAGLAAAGGSSASGFPVGAIGGVPAIPGYDLPDGRIDLVGITLNVIGPGGDQGPANLVSFAQANFGVGQGAQPPLTAFQAVDAAGDQFVPGQQVPEGYLVTPHDGVGITAAQVQQIIEQGIAEANQVRAQIRLPNGERTRMVLAVTDKNGAVVGLYRMPDATVFSIDVAVAKARNEAYYNDPTQLQPQDKLPEVPAGTALTNRTFRFLALPRYPEGIDGAPPGPFSILNSPGINGVTAQNTGAPLPASVYDNTVFGYDSFHPNTNFRDPNNLANQNGIVFFPGSTGIYIDGHLLGGWGVSGDGVDQDDVVTAGGIKDFEAPNGLRADQFFVRGVRLPYLKYPRNPLAA